MPKVGYWWPGKPARASHRVAEGESVQVEVVSRPPLAAAPEDIPIETLYEDDDLVVVNKPAGMIVHAGAGQSRGTLVNALLHRLGTLSSTAGRESARELCIVWIGELRAY